MAVNNTLSVKEYTLTGGGANTFPITFEFTTDDNSNAENIHCQIAEKNETTGEYINSRELAEGVGGDFQVDGGNVKFLDDQPEYADKFLIIYRSTPVTQLTDFIDNGNYSLEDIERALDKLTYIVQERTGTPSGTYTNVSVSLFFASLFKLTNKADLLKNLFNWTYDITDPDDRSAIAAAIRSCADLISKSGDETIGGHKTFTYSPDLMNDPLDGNKATRKSYVDSYFPVATANIGDSQVTTAKIADANVTTAKIADANVTTAKIADSNITTSKIADGNVTRDKLSDYAVNIAKLNKARDTVSLTYDSGDQEYKGTWYGYGSKLPYYCSASASVDFLNGGWRLSIKHNSNTCVVDYIL